MVTRLVKSIASGTGSVESSVSAFITESGLRRWTRPSACPISCTVVARAPLSEALSSRPVYRVIVFDRRTPPRSSLSDSPSVSSPPRSRATMVEQFARDGHAATTTGSTHGLRAQIRRLVDEPGVSVRKAGDREVHDDPLAAGVRPWGFRAVVGIDVLLPGVGRGRTRIRPAFRAGSAGRLRQRP